MKAPLSWLRAFVPELPADPQPIADALTMGGLPVEHIETLANGDRVLDVEVTSNRADAARSSKTEPVGGFWIMNTGKASGPPANEVEM